MKKNQNERPFIFTKINYLLMVGGIILMAIGYLIMKGGGSDDPNVFNEEIFSTSRIRVAPALITLGFITQIFAIMYKPEESKK